MDLQASAPDQLLLPPDLLCITSSLRLPLNKFITTIMVALPLLLLLKLVAVLAEEASEVLLPLVWQWVLGLRLLTRLSEASWAVEAAMDMLPLNKLNQLPSSRLLSNMLSQFMSSHLSRWLNSRTLA